MIEILTTRFLLDLNSTVLGRIEAYLKKKLAQQRAVSQDMLKLCHTFSENLFEHNDQVARWTPVCGANATYSFLSQRPQKGQGQRTSVTDGLAPTTVSTQKLDGEVFELEVDSTSNSPSSEPTPSTTTAVTSANDSNWSVVSRSPKLGGNSPSFGASTPRPILGSSPPVTSMASSPNQTQLQTPFRKSRAPSLASSPGQADFSPSPWKVGPNTSVKGPSKTGATPYRISPMAYGSAPKFSPGGSSSGFNTTPNNSTVPLSTIPLGTKQPIVKSPPITRSKLNQAGSALSSASSVSVARRGSASSSSPAPAAISSPAVGSVFTPVVKDGPSVKMSQKERKRLLREQQQQQQQSPQSQQKDIAPSTPMGWGNPFQPSSPSPSQSPWNVPRTSPAVATASVPPSVTAEVRSKTTSIPAPGSTVTEAESPFAMYAKGKEKAKKPIEQESPAFTLNDIIQQEKHDLKKRNEKSSRSLKDIQREEEFEKWWALESQRAQGVGPVEDESSCRPADTKSHNNNRRKHGKPKNRANSNTQSHGENHSGPNNQTSGEATSSNNHQGRRNQRLTVNT
ncbi:putative ankyrin repeat protein [Sugiyamaella lignohabitans]|uniref:Putative ankyrin repeat protein n=1 Tax=Sugiyamaella lignohabitans TaxID=796027 RepID=A0A167E4Z9_9ASCO|nr:putative ankyrin repeat protein [Sugiyamaella lignohabitans]ANB13646.1 putative ankyrin repeat protein [Sugiyamaella lignohabitans]